MNILIANDDGINSEGLYELVMQISKIGRVYVAAPEREQSAVGHGITMHQVLRCKEVDIFGPDIKAWWVNGTPADCVKLAIESLMKEKPDLVISGINKGENSGTDVIYSGTVSAAIEGVIFGIPSLAFSYTSYSQYNFRLAAQISKRIVEQALKNGIPEHTMLNVNIPHYNDESEIGQIKVTKLGIKQYKNSFEERKDPRGNRYFWLAGENIERENDEDTDINAIKNKNISITPMHIDLTNYKVLKTIESWGISI